MAITKKIREDRDRGENLSLNEDEMAFYDALGVNDSTVKILGDEVLCAIARKLTERERNSLTIDWQVKESTRAGIRVLVKQILRKYGYPPYKEKKAVETVLEQTEHIAELWAT